MITTHIEGDIMATPVIVGVDGSPTANKAAAKARDIAVKLNAPLHVVSAHTQDDISHIKSGSDEWIVSSSDKALNLAEKVAKDLRTSEVEVEAAVAHGKPSDALTDYAKTHDAEMIVVGNQRTRGMARVLGSVANSVCQKATVDVYIANTYES